MTCIIRRSILSCVLLLLAQSASSQQVLRFQTPDATYTIDLSASGVAASPLAAQGAIPLWNGSFVYQGATYPLTMVGSDPSVPGAGASNVPAVIIPLRFKFGSTVISPAQKACGDSVSVLARVRNSPLFTSSVKWEASTTSLGKTQFADAFQRGNFWNFVSTISPNYHVVLKPITVTPVQTLDVAASDGYAEAGLCAGHSLGVVSISYWLNAAYGILNALDIHPNTVAIFVAYDVGTTPTLGGNVRPLTGFGINAGNGQMFVAASYTEPNAFIPSPGGVSFLSSMLASWMDDPLILGNKVPGWTPIWSGEGCVDWIMAGAPLFGTTFPVVQNKITYDIQEPAFLSWFARESPSQAVNGWYSMQSTLKEPPPTCQ
jgi:hypothetical protein